MPGAMHRMGVYLGLVEEDESAYADAYAGGHEWAEEARGGSGLARASGFGAERVPDRAVSGDSRPARDARPVTRYDSHFEGHADYAEPQRPAEQPSYQITAVHPRTYNEARTIGEHFRSSTPVIMNLSEMDDADAKRLVDFAAGLTFGLHGRIERVTAKVFLLSPHNVTVTAQDRARMAESGFFNQS